MSVTLGVALEKQLNCTVSPGVPPPMVLLCVTLISGLYSSFRVTWLDLKSLATEFVEMQDMFCLSCSFLGIILIIEIVRNVFVS